LSGTAGKSAENKMMTQFRTRRGGATCVAVTRGELKAVEEFKYVGSVLTSNSNEWIDVRRLPNADVMKRECVHHSFIHSVLCLTTRPFLFTKYVLQVRSSASSFNFQYASVSLRSSSSCLRRLPRFTITYSSFYLSFNSVF